MSDVQHENGAPERIGKLIGIALAALVVLAVVAIMIRQFA
jgi:hypothetical protein